MAEYIEREKAIEHIETHLPYRCSEDFIEGQKDCVEQLKLLPSADVVEVVHGRWEHPCFDVSDYWRCSACGEEWFFEYDPTEAETKVNYCPNCGAKMDGDKDA